ncbi:MAG: hypothetical protein L3J12_04240 [Spirochaetales bacterium]|nr:hypothetical protein [Spirochaetales bacterium]
MNLCTKRVFLLIIVFLIVLSFNLFSAETDVTNMELISRAILSNGIPVLTTRGKVDLRVGGGYKLGGNLILGFDSMDLGYSSADISDYSGTSQELATFLSNQTYLKFQSAEIAIRDLFSSTTELTYFIGKTDVLGSGDDFPTLFGSVPINTRYRGYLYFPNSEFDGIHRINGTGFKLSTNFGSDRINSSAYIYQDGYLGDGYFSSDLRVLMNFDKVKIEGFLGGSFPASSMGLYRAGFLFYYSPGSTGEFFAQIGIPQWDPAVTFDINRLFFLFEPRIKLNNMTIILTLFLHPGFYLQYPTADAGSSDVHINFLIGDPLQSTFYGGLEGGATYSSSGGSNQFGVVISPYLSVITSGVIWNLMLNTQLLPYSLNEMFEGVISVKAEF